MSKHTLHTEELDEDVISQENVTMYTAEYYVYRMIVTE